MLGTVVGNILSQFEAIQKLKKVQNVLSILLPSSSVLH
jgi:hypothetical protein